MKKISLFIFLAISLSFFDCKKEEMFEIPPEPDTTLRSTEIEGKLINHISQLPIVGQEIILWDIGYNSSTESHEAIEITDTTDSNGEFYFKHTEQIRLPSQSYITLNIWADEYDNTKTIINGENNTYLPSYIYWPEFVNYPAGLALAKEEYHSLLIEFTPKE